MRSKLTPNTSVKKPKKIGMEIAKSILFGLSFEDNNTIRKLRERYKGVRAKKLALAEEIIPKTPDIVDNQTNPM